MPKEEEEEEEEKEEEDGGKSEHQATFLSAMKGIDIEEILYKLWSQWKHGYPQ